MNVLSWKLNLKIGSLKIRETIYSFQCEEGRPITELKKRENLAGAEGNKDLKVRWLKLTNLIGKDIELG